MKKTTFLNKLLTNRKLLLTATTLATSLFASAPAFASDWLDCGDPSKGCYAGNSGNVVTVKYGANGVYFYHEYFNITTTPCGDDVGDPVFGTRKSCAVLPKHFSNLTVAPSTGACATEGQYCSIPDGATHWVYYGEPGGRMVGAIKSGISILCNSDNFRWDPAYRVNKSCFIGPKVFQTAYGVRPTWTQCAVAEGQQCKPDKYYAQIVVAYGVGSKWEYKLATLDEGKSITCNLTTFRRDPAPGQAKGCMWLAVNMHPSTVAEKGVWSSVVSIAAGEGSVTNSIMYGLQETDTVTKGNAWTTTVTASVGVSGNAPFTNVNSSLSVSQAYARSSSFQNAMAVTYGQTTGATCNNFPRGGKLWQFNADVTAACVKSGTCTARMTTTDYACIPNSPNGAQPTPKCLPGKCDLLKSDQCQICTN